MIRRSTAGALPGPQRTVSTGPMQIKDVGQAGQIMRGRTLAVSDFTTLGLSGPKGLWNFTGGSLNDSSGNGFTFTGTKNNVVDMLGNYPTQDAISPVLFGFGLFSASNSLKQGFGTWGCWLRLPANFPFVTTNILAMYKSASELSFTLTYNYLTKALTAKVSTSGSNTVYWSTTGTTFLGDNKWHFITMSWDGTQLRLHVDGHLDAPTIPTATGAATYGPMYTGSSSALFTAGCSEFDGASDSVFLGDHIDEIFVTPDVLNESQIRFLMCSKVMLPTTQINNIQVRVRNYSRTSDYTSADFSPFFATPLVGYNLDTSVTPTTDNYGSLGRTLTANGGTIATGPDVDGIRNKAPWLASGSTQYYSASDTSLPNGSGSRTIGIWFKAPVVSATTPHLMSYGTNTTNNGYSVYLNGTGGVVVDIVGDSVTLPGVVIPHKWTFLGIEQTNNANFAFYIDGTYRDLLSLTSGSVNTTLSGNFRIGAKFDNTNPFLGNIAGLWILSGVFSALAPYSFLYNKQGIYLGSQMLIDPSDVIVSIIDNAAYCDFTNFPGTSSVELIVS